MRLYWYTVEVNLLWWWGFESVDVVLWFTSQVEDLGILSSKRSEVWLACQRIRQSRAKTYLVEYPGCLNAKKKNDWYMGTWLYSIPTLSIELFYFFLWKYTSYFMQVSWPQVSWPMFHSYLWYLLTSGCYVQRGLLMWSSLVSRDRNVCFVL